MPIARSNNRLLYFAHILKTGGSSVESYMAQKGHVALIQARRSGWARSTAQHIQAAVFVDFFRDGFCDAGFAILRDPMGRLISEYKMRQTAAGKPREPARATRGVRSFARLMLRHHPGWQRVPCFDEWVALTFAQYRRDPYIYDNHIRPQVEFVHPAHRLFRFEDGLGPVLRWIDEVTDTPPAEVEFHRRKGSTDAVPCAAATEALIHDFYRADYAMIEDLWGRAELSRG